MLIVSEMEATGSSVSKNLSPAHRPEKPSAYMPDFVPTPENIALIKADGFSGLCAGLKFFETEDPVASISETISILTTL